MKVTLTAIKADIGSVGGHTEPSKEVFDSVKEHIQEKGLESKLLIDCYIGYTGDDIHILMSHEHGVNTLGIHELAWDAFMAGTEIATKQGLYGAGQDLLSDAFSGNIRGLGPGVAEMEFKERPADPFVLFTADKTEPGAFNWPFYALFIEVSKNSGLILNKRLSKGLIFKIMDVSYIDADKIIELKTPEEYLDIATLLREPHRYVIESIYSRGTREQIAALSTTRLHNIAGKYVGKDDPIAIVRNQGAFAATEETCSVFKDAHYVGGNTRGSHNMPLMPVTINSMATTNYCIPIVSSLCFSMKNGKFTAYIDGFSTPDWDEVRRKAFVKAEYMREQGFIEPATLSREEVEYNDSVKERLEELDKRFVIKQ